MTVLSSLVFVVSRLLAQLLGAGRNSNLISNVAEALAFALVGAGVWIYHALSLRSDSRLNRREWAEGLAAWRVAVIDSGEGQIGSAVLKRLRQELPGLTLDPISLTPAASAAMNGGAENIAERLLAAQVIVGQWAIAAGGDAPGGASEDVAAAVRASPARKILIPTRDEPWEWVGVSRWNAGTLALEAARAVGQVIRGEKLKPARPLGAGAIALIVLGVLFGLQLLVGLIFLLVNAGQMF